MNKNLGNILITGGSGFIGSNLIYLLNKEYKFKQIISIDNYFTGNKKNHIKSKKIIYLRLDTTKINKTNNKIFLNFKPNFVFHLAEFSRIVPSFKHIRDCYNFNVIGTFNVIQYSLKHNAKLIYSGSSSKFGKKDNQHLSPYSWTKSKNIELIKNYNTWFGLRYSVVYYFNVYGFNQIRSHFMSAVIGIFEEQFMQNIPLTVVKPGNQKRDFTHVKDIVKGTVLAAVKGKNKEYQLGSGKNYKVLDVAKMFCNNIKYIKKRDGERFTSLSNYSLAKNELGYKPDYNLEEYIKKFISKNHKKTYKKKLIKLNNF